MKRSKNPPRIARRNFVKSCAGIMALGLQKRAYSGQLNGRKAYTRSRLVDGYSRPFRAQDLNAGETYLFHYPFVSTPCFLINVGRAVRPGKPLQTESGDRYQWPGGVGPNGSIVAFSAICAHKMTHPSKSVSFINYRPETITYTNNYDRPEQGSHLIYCCSERSVYDVRDGARVLGGPANQPLTAIGLEYDPEQDSLSATGTFGGEMYQQFFTQFGNRLRLEYEVDDVEAEIGRATMVQHIGDFTDSKVLC
jgi:arsenite oxidase small subunit